MIFSQSRRTEIGQIFDNVHKTFGRTITAYKDAENNVVASTPSYNAIYGTAANSNVSKSTVSSTFTARIRHIKNGETILVDNAIDSQIKIQLPAGSVRVKVDEIGFDFLRESKRIDLDGERYIILNDSDAKPIGPFSPDYFIFYLRPIDEH